MNAAQRARRRLEHAYRNTTYRVHAPEGAIDVRIGHLHPDLDQLLGRNGVSTWAIVTAFNPHSERLTEVENWARHELLVSSVRDQGWTAIEAEGLPADDTWLSEQGLLIYAIGEFDALSLAARFEQSAIVAGEHDQPARLIWIDHPRRR